MFKPNIYVQHVTNIPLQKLSEKGIKLLAYDLDNTLDLPDRMTDKVIQEVEQHLNLAEQFGFDIMIISNNTIPGRVESFAKLRNYKYIEGARKPFQKSYNTNDVINSYKKEQICFIGDKLVTDVLGANKYGSFSILVDPLQPKAKHWYTKIMKVSESILTSLIGFKKGNYYE